MTRAALGKRLAALEAATSTGPALGWVCIPMMGDPKAYHVEIAPGIYRDTAAGSNTRRTVQYASQELLEQWLAEPEQAGQRHCTYHVLTEAECDAIRQELEATI